MTKNHCIMHQQQHHIVAYACCMHTVFHAAAPASSFFGLEWVYGPDRMGVSIYVLVLRVLGGAADYSSNLASWENINVCCVHHRHRV